MLKASKEVVLRDAPESIRDLSKSDDIWWVDEFDDGDICVEGEEMFRLIGIYNDETGDRVEYLTAVFDVDDDNWDYDEGYVYDEWLLDQLWSWWGSGSVEPFRVYSSLV